MIFGRRRKIEQLEDRLESAQRALIKQTREQVVQDETLEAAQWSVAILKSEVKKLTDFKAVVLEYLEQPAGKKGYAAARKRLEAAARL